MPINCCCIMAPNRAPAQKFKMKLTPHVQLKIWKSYIFVVCIFPVLCLSHYLMPCIFLLLNRSRETGLESNTRDHKQQDHNWQLGCSCAPQNHTYNITCYSKEESDYHTCRTTHWQGWAQHSEASWSWQSWWPSHKITGD